jgi:hypothetical protein
MQNLLPVLALRPARLIHLVTPKVRGRSGPIAVAARDAQIEVDPEPVHLPEMPTIRETFAATARAIREVKQSDGLPIVNFTGGTKLMSIGAFRAALHEKAPSLYVDTEHGRFLDGNTGDGILQMLGDNLTFHTLQSALRVHTVALANGCHSVSRGKDWSKYLPLADHLLTHSEEEERCHEVFYGADGLCPKGRGPRKKKDWLVLAEQALDLSEETGRLGVAAGLLQPNDRGGFTLERTATEVQRLQFAVTFFTGGWWEVAVVRAANQAGVFSDLRWSASFGAQSANGRLEEDIVGLDGVQIVYISCKRSAQGQRPLAHLEEIESRARRIGGKFARKFLAVRLPITDRNLRDALGRRAGELQIRVIGPGELAQPGCFSRA